MTLALRWKYPLTSSMKSSALDLSPLKIWGRLPIAFMSAATCTGCWAAAGCPPPLGCLGPLPPGSPDPPPPGSPDPLPPGSPDPFPLCRSAFCIVVAILCCAMGAGLNLDMVAVDIVVVLVAVAVIAVRMLLGKLIVLIIGLLHSAGSMGVCLICWSTVGPLPSLCCFSSLFSLLVSS